MLQAAVLGYLDAARSLRRAVELHADCCLPVGVVRSWVEGAWETREPREEMEDHSALPTPEENAVDADWELRGLGGLGGLGMIQMEEVVQQEHPSEAVQQGIEAAELEHEDADGQGGQQVVDEAGEYSQPAVSDGYRC